MTFTNLTTGSIVAGLIAIAGLLYAIQLLRIRYRKQPVATLQFWREAVVVAPARTFWQRFRHPLAYLLFLLICSLLWLAFAEPETDDHEGSHFTILLLDGSALMSRPGRFESVVQQLTSDVEGLPRDQRQVIWAGGQSRTLLNPGEHEMLLSERLKIMVPEAAPSTIGSQLRTLSNVHRREQQVSVRVYSDEAIDPQLAGALANKIEIIQATEPAASVVENHGITALGVGDSATGNWQQVDVYFQLGTNQQLPVGTAGLNIELDGVTLDSSLLKNLPDNGGYLIEGLPAQGQTLTLSLRQDDAIALDNKASILLPNKQPVRLQISDSIPVAITELLKLDTGVELVNSSADVVLRRRGEQTGGELPALELVSSELQQQTFVISTPENADEYSVFLNALNSLGLAQIDATSLAQGLQKSIGVALEYGNIRKLSVWSELFSSDYNLVTSRRYPVMISNSLRWLAGQQSWVPYAAAGEPLQQVGIGPRLMLASPNGEVINTLGSFYLPTTAGEVALAGSEDALQVSLLSGSVTGFSVNEVESGSQVMNFKMPDKNNLALWIVSMVLLLLLVEWTLYQRGRIP